MKRYNLAIIINTLTILILITSSSSSIAKVHEKESVGGEPLQDVLVVNQSDWLIIPHLYYKPETKTAGGVVFLTYFQDVIMSIPPIKLRPSTFALTLTYTQKKQFIFQLFPEFYFYRNKYHLKNEFQYLNYPDKFYGIGPDTTQKDMEQYTSRIFSFKNIIERSLFPDFYIGLIYHFDKRENTKAQPGGLIANRSVLGAKDGLVSGVGFTVNYDSRDNIMYTLDGVYANLSIIQYSRYLKSDFNFTNIIFDYRFYEPFWFSHVLALQIYAGYIYGDAPFYLLSQMGGAKIMRGLYEGRYRDNNIIVTQAEYRIPLFWRFILCGFVGMGEVAPSLREFDRKHIVYAYGGGLRYKLKQEQNLNMRLDIGFSKNFTGIYVTIGEAI